MYAKIAITKKIIYHKVHNTFIKVDCHIYHFSAKVCDQQTQISFIAVKI